MEKESLSTKARNYAIAGACLVFAFFIGGLAIGIFTSGRADPVNVWSECEGQSANVFIGANGDLQNVRCVALDEELFAEPEIAIEGGMSKNDEEVCRFKLKGNATEPSLKFEVHYNDGKVRREVCNWQNSLFVGGGID